MDKRLALLVEELSHALIAADAIGTTYLRCSPEELEAAAPEGRWSTYLHDAGEHDRFALDSYRVKCGVGAAIEAHRHRAITDEEMASLAAEPVKTHTHRSSFR